MFRKLAVLVTLVCLLISPSSRRAMARWAIHSSSFSSDGRYGLFYWHSIDQDVVRLFDFEAAETLRIFSVDSCPYIALSPEGKYTAISYACGESAQFIMRIWDNLSGKQVSEFSIPKVEVYTILKWRFSPDSHLFLISTAEQGSYVIDVLSGVLKQHFVYRTWEDIYTTQFSTDSKYLLTGTICVPGTQICPGMILWNIETGKLIHAFHNGLYGRISADMRRISVVTPQDELYIYDFTSGQQVYLINKNFGFGGFSPDGRFVMDDDSLKPFPGRHEPRLFDAYQLKRIFPNPRSEHRLLFWDWSADSKSIILYEDESRWHYLIWDILDATPIGRITLDRSDSIEFFPYRKIYAISTSEDCIQLHNTKRDLVEKVYCPLGDNRNPAN